ncbi:DUF4347 domain-containing protein [Pseudomonas laurylsulfatiphila]|uniref:DUF4347 domain-containing protein n=1 Tax=Pseudomonas laurylsulfatiphila TaxID=2011015 RepID=UPI0023EF22F5|nr:DUF4347 domain-containing protein [Pseudomonas laurylsulfatiphila]
MANYQALIAQLGSDTQWVLLDADKDGLSQMQAVLAGYSGLSSIQIISHGSVGALYLGSTVLDSSSLSVYQSQLQSIGQSLAAAGDILLYGCNVAQGEQGQAFIERLAQITGADVAASDDLSGAFSQGGDSQLEVHAGVIEANTLDLAAYAATLAVINGTDGNDTLEGTVDNDTILGGAGSDQISGSGGADYIVGGDELDYWGGDRIQGGPGNDTILGGAGNDYLDGNTGNDNLDGGAGDDSLTSSSGEGSDTLRGGDGNDLFTVWSTSGTVETVLIDGGAGDDLIQTFMYSAGNRTLTATGGAGVDTYTFLSGGYTANYSVTDFIAGVGGDRLDVSKLLDYSAADGRGYEGGNPMRAEQGYLRLLQSGADTLLQYDEDGAAGTAYTWHTAVTLQNVLASTLTVANFVGAIAPDGSDVPGLKLTGTVNNDTLQGSYFNDTILGGAGSDQISGSGGADYIVGGDELDYWGGDRIQGGPGNDTILGGAGNDYLDGNTGNDSLDGGAGDDSLTSSSGEGSDTLRGGDGNDRFTVWSTSGKAETVLIDGGAGDDLIQTFMYSAGNRTLTATGGAGVDTYTFLSGGYTANYSVTDFFAGAGGDRLDVSTLLDYSAADGRGYEGGNPMRAEQGYLRLLQSGADTLLQYDEDGAAGTAYTWHTAITLQNVLASTLTTANFVGAIAPDGSDVPGLQLTGTVNNDTLQGSHFADTILGGAGSDQISGSGGADYIVGGDELDQWGGDRIQGGSGNDTILGGAGNDYLDGNTGNDSLDGGAGDDSLNSNSGEGSDTLRGGDGNDRFTVWSTSGTAETVLIDGGAGDDLIQTFMYSAGNRTLTATGGAGVDTYTFLSGGYTANYSVTDFVAGAGGDRLDVSKLLDYSATDGRGYEGGNPMRAEQGYLRLLQSGADTLLQYDEDGTAGTAYAWHTAITLKNVMATAINAHNFKPLTIEGTAGADTLEGGLGVDTLNGGAGDDVLDGNWGDDSMTGGTGNDTYYVDNLGDLVKEVANEGADKVVATIDYVLASNVENLTLGSGAAAGTGNALDNTLTGNATANTLNGGAGADTLAGGLGNDTYVVDNALDVVSETSALASEIDTVQSSASWTLGANLERLVLTGAAAINGTGNALNNTLTGNATANTLNGGAGADTLAGGLGNDTYVVDNALDVVSETSALASEIDTVQSSATWTLGANLERLVLTGAAAINGTGNALNNTLTGNATANTLNGGAGADTLAGGLGNDTYVVDNALDVVSETSTLASEIDTVQSSATWTLGANLEKLVLTGDAAINGTGNALNNTLTGNATANTLNGGAGADTLVGGLGNDNYVVDNALDVVSETSALASEIDTVQSSVSWTLGANLENLRLLATGIANATGNSLNNVIYAGTGNNILDGSTGIDTASYAYAASAIGASLATNAAQATGGSGLDTLLNFENLTGSNYNDTLIGNQLANVLNGGTGADRLSGGDGSDIYFVDNIGDSVNETNTLVSTGGEDTVFSYLTDYTLSSNVENLRVLATGTANSTGNSLNNLIYAGSGNNSLDGAAGIDTASYAYAGSAVSVSLAIDAAQATGGSGSDTLLNFENLTGGNFNDILTGSTTANTLSGGAGNDTLNGGAGNDLLLGGTGVDRLNGGSGADRFDFNALSEMGLGVLRDVLGDFKTSEGDKLDLSTLDANTATATNEAFIFIGSSTFGSNAAGQLRFASGMLYGSTDADSAAEFEIQLLGVSTLNTTDLIA